MTSVVPWVTAGMTAGTLPVTVLAVEVPASPLPVKVKVYETACLPEFLGSCTT